MRTLELQLKYGEIDELVVTSSGNIVTGFIYAPYIPMMVLPTIVRLDGQMG